mgnify:CR=1 FL=1
MIKSMTGYGRARQELHKRDITVEVRSVNNRYLDCTVKMPRMYAFAEDAVKKHVQQAVSRGKVDVFITVDATAADVVKVAVNRELAAQYAAALGELSDVCGTADYRPAPETLARFPDVLTVTKADEDLETVSVDLCAVLDEALAAYNDMRAVEGQKLAEDISNRLDAIERYTGQVEMRSPETVAEYRAKLTDLDTTGDFLLASVRPAPVRVGKTEDAVETEALLRALKSSFDEYLDHPCSNRQMPLHTLPICGMAVLQSSLLAFGQCFAQRVSVPAPAFPIGGTTAETRYGNPSSVSGSRP